LNSEPHTNVDSTQIIESDMVEDKEFVRLRKVYTERSKKNSFKYSLFNPAQLFLSQQRQRKLIDLLRHCNITNLGQIEAMLEVGCGDGFVLQEYIGLGLPQKNIYGTDVLAERLTKAHSILPNIPLACADGRALPYRADSFDLVILYTVMSSILDKNVQKQVIDELLRVVKPNGIIMFYDFWLNPNNPNTIGITKADLRHWFPDSQLIARRVTLAPPLSRRIVHRAWWLGTLLEALWIFNTHNLVAILPPNDAHP
jgi:ubiquinone/menaquinone biosynthesis C-methylase UbiE